MSQQCEYEISLYSSVVQVRLIGITPMIDHKHKRAALYKYICIYMCVYVNYQQLAIQCNHRISHNNKNQSFFTFIFGAV